MIEADVRNAGMSKETEDDFREMTNVQRVFPFVSIARNMYSICNLEFKTWNETDLLSARESHTQWSWADWRDQARRHCRVRGGGCTRDTKGDKVRGWWRKGSGAADDDVGDVAWWSRYVRRQSFDTFCDLRVVIIRYLWVTKKSTSMMRSDSASITTNLVQNLIKRDKRVHKDKSEDSITQEDFFAMVQ